MLNKLKRAALGAHTPHDKATAASKPIPMPLPAQVRILMSQHIGAPAKALVKKGDEVFVGTKIGEAGGFVSANIHSSVSGTVAAVEPFRLSNGRMCDSVVIKTDGKQTVDPAVKAPEVTDKASFLAAVRECGLVGLGGAGFPTDVKLQPKQSVDTLLINASECEVWLTSDTQVVIQDDYHNLPRRTKKQKKYYKQAERKVKREAVKRMDTLFAMLERQNPSLKNVSIYERSSVC